MHSVHQYFHASNVLEELQDRHVEDVNAANVRADELVSVLQANSKLYRELSEKESQRIRGLETELQSLRKFYDKATTGGGATVGGKTRSGSVSDAPRSPPHSPTTAPEMSLEDALANPNRRGSGGSPDDAKGGTTYLAAWMSGGGGGPAGGNGPVVLGGGRSIKGGGGGGATGIGGRRLSSTRPPPPPPPGPPPQSSIQEAIRMGTYGSPTQAADGSTNPFATESSSAATAASGTASTTTPTGPRRRISAVSSDIFAFLNSGGRPPSGQTPPPPPPPASGDAATDAKPAEGTCRQS